MNWNITGEEQQIKLIGTYQEQIELTLFPQKIKPAGHVVILALYQGQLLFTKHKTRGLEWPGGKVEQGESQTVAARRELWEETGAECSYLWLVGQYKVNQPGNQFFVKNIYATEIIALDPSARSGVDTDGAVLLPIQVKPSKHEGFSPFMLDGVFSSVRAAVLSQWL